MNKITHYFKGVGEEARRVRWPDRKTLWKSVAIVLSLAIITALALALDDFLASKIMEVMPSKQSGGSEEGEEVALLITSVVARIKGGL